VRFQSYDGFVFHVCTGFNHKMNAACHDEFPARRAVSVPIIQPFKISSTLTSFTSRSTSARSSSPGMSVSALAAPGGRPSARLPQIIAAQQSPHDAGGESVAGTNRIGRLDSRRNNAPENFSIKRERRLLARRHNHPLRAAFAQFLHRLHHVRVGLNSRPTVAASSERFGLTSPGFASSAAVSARPARPRWIARRIFQQASRNRDKNSADSQARWSRHHCCPATGDAPLDDGHELFKIRRRDGAAFFDQFSMPARRLVNHRDALACWCAHCDEIGFDFFFQHDRAQVSAAFATRKPVATGFSPSTFNTFATLMALPATVERRHARFTASGVSLRKSITRCTAGVVPMQRIMSGSPPPARGFGFISFARTA